MKEQAEQIVLTGFRGTGKTSVGRLLAARLGYDFVDADHLLAERLGGTIAECVARYGWERFREAERQLLTEVPAMTRTVLATGGGAIEHDDAWRELRKHAMVVWLDADIATIRDRIGSDPLTASQRPSLTGLALEDELEQVLCRRTPLYAEGSDLRLDTVGVDPQALAEGIASEIQRRHAAPGGDRGGNQAPGATGRQEGGGDD